MSNFYCHPGKAGGSPIILVDLPRAESLLSKVLAAEPNSALAHYVKADFLTYEKKQFNDALSELDVAIDNDRNFARAYSIGAGRSHLQRRG